MKCFSNSAFFCLFFVLFLIAGCAPTYRIDYANISPDISASGSKSVVVATYDQRKYIVPGGKLDNFVGLFRGGYGTHYDVSTQSGRSLASDITGDIVDALSKKGFKAQSVNVLPSDTFSAVIHKLTAANADCMVLLTMHEWKTDTWLTIHLTYDIEIKVLDRAGNTLAEKETVGSEDLGESILRPANMARELAPQTFKQKLEQILNSSEVVNALR